MHLLHGELVPNDLPNKLGLHILQYPQGSGKNIESVCAGADKSPKMSGKGNPNTRSEMFVQVSNPPTHRRRKRMGGVSHVRTLRSEPASFRQVHRRANRWASGGVEKILGNRKDRSPQLLPCRSV